MTQAALSLSPKLSHLWLKAAIVGSIWAAFEIIVGSFLHNLKIPFSGSFLSAASVFLILSFARLWPDRWLILRAGIICALMKSISPSAVIFGPMVGILSEAVFIEIFTLFFGKNLLGYALGGAFAVLSSLFQKIFNWLLMYGFNLISISEELYHYFQKQTGFDYPPSVLIYSVVGIYILMGWVAAMLGYYAGGRYLKKNRKSFDAIKLHSDAKNPFADDQSITHAHPWINILLLIGAMLASMMVINLPNPWLALLLGAIFPLILILFYKKSMRRLRKPGIWIQFISITLLASLFWEYLQTGAYFSVDGLWIGLRMNLRAIVVILSFAALSVELKNPLVRTLLYQKGFANLYNSMSLSFAILPSIIEILPKNKFKIKTSLNLLEMMLGQAEQLLQQFTAHSKATIFILTGARHAGKTSYLMALLEQLNLQQIPVEGLLSRSIYKNQEPFEYRLVNLKTQEEKVLCQREPQEGFQTFGRFYFDLKTVDWGKTILKETDSQSLLVIDEVGKMELEQNEGWWEALVFLTQNRQQPQLWVMREDFVGLLSQAFPQQAFRIIKMDDTKVEVLRLEIEVVLKSKEDLKK